VAWLFDFLKNGVDGLGELDLYTAHRRRRCGDAALTPRSSRASRVCFTWSVKIGQGG